MKFALKAFSFISFLKLSSALLPIIPTQYGPVQGIIKTTETGRTYYSFQGIPFAAPPDGPLRFKDPQPPTPWTESLDCTLEGPQFWGYDYVTGLPGGSFDALHVNIYSNNIYTDTPYPVMVWIHGGAFRSGSGLTDFHGPDYLIEKNITLVTIQYRLAAFGFLSLDDPALKVPGNAGMKDQRLGLQWVQQNIKNFGGDPNQVTLFGQSAGGSSVYFHALSENSRGLFQRAIAMAGTALSANYIPRRQWAQRLAAVLGFHSTDETQILTFLENADPADIVVAQNLVIPEETMLEEGFGAPFAPLREPYDTEGVFLNDDLTTLSRNAWSNDINLMVTATSLETLEALLTFRLRPDLFEMVLNFENFIPRELNIEQETEKSKKYAQMIKNLYYPVLEPTITNIDGILFALHDTGMFWNMHRSIQFRLQARTSASTYVMRFDADTENNIFNTLMGEVFPEGAIYRYPMHSDDNANIFKTFLHGPVANRSIEAQNTLQLMVSMFTNFAATGDPSVPEMDINFRAVTSADPPLTGLNVHETNTEFKVLPEALRVSVLEEITLMENSSSNRNKLFVSSFLIVFLYFIKF